MIKLLKQVCGEKRGGRWGKVEGGGKEEGWVCEVHNFIQKMCFLMVVFPERVPQDERWNG